VLSAIPALIAACIIIQALIIQSRLMILWLMAGVMSLLTPISLVRQI